MRKRTTQLYFNLFGIKLVIWRKKYRPIHRPRVTSEQIDRARKNIIRENH